MITKRCKELNHILKGLCGLYNFTFIDNSDILSKCLLRDGVHLNEEGSVKLACNFLDHLNGETGETGET